MCLRLRALHFRQNVAAFRCQKKCVNKKQQVHHCDLERPTMQNHSRQFQKRMVHSHQRGVLKM